MNKEITKEERFILRQKRKQNIVRSSNAFYHTKWAFITLLSISGGFFILQILFQYFEILDTTSGGAEWLIWTSIGLSGFSGILQQAGSVYSMRYNAKHSTILTLTGHAMAVANSFLLRLYFTAITFSFGMIITILRYFKWTKETDNTDKSSPIMWLKLLLILSVFATIGGLLYGYNVIPFGYDDMPKDFEYLKWIDVANSTFIIGGMIAISYKTRYAFVIFFLSGIFGIWMYVLFQNYIVIVSILIFKINEIVAFIAWSNNAPIKKEKLEKIAIKK